MPVLKARPLSSNLPVPLSSFIGREREINDVKHLLPAARLVSLTGVGGCGKTRLAIEVARSVFGTYDDAICWVELASLADEALLPQTVAEALHVREIPNQALSETLANFLKSKNLLLVLDNCEHLISACAQLSEQLLRACPDLKILATSREPLGIDGETVYQVPTLSLPEPSASSLRQLLRSEAMCLFVERARAGDPGFSLTEQNGRAAAQICRRLDGIPLAIELAAVRVKLLSVEHLAERLDDRFNLLTSGSHTALPRHQTLRATIDWSYDLLPEEARVLFRRLAVFAGGFTLEAAEQICADESLLKPAVVDRLGRLVDRSLVIVVQQAEEERYGLLETIREYAREKCSASGEEERVQQRHFDFFLKLAEQAEPRLYEAQEASWLNRLEREHDNLRRALEWSQGTDDRNELGLRLAGALGKFWEIRGYFREGREYISAALSRATVSGTSSHTKAVFTEGDLAFEQGDFQVARARLEQSISAYRKLGASHRAGLAEALRQCGYCATEMGDYATASRMLTEALGTMRELKNPTGIARTLWQLGWAMLRSGDFEHAAQYFEEALPMVRQIGSKYQMSLVLSGLADLRFYRGDYEAAAALEEESLQCAREVGYTWRVPASLGSLARIAIRQGNLKKAAALLGESITLRREIGEQGGTAWCLEKFAEVALIQAQHESSARQAEAFGRAARLYGAAATLRAAIGSALDLIDQSDYERHLALIRGRLGQAAFKTIWAEGQAMALEQAIAYALEAATPPEQLVKQAFGGLTGRERQVAELIAQGKSNREIAQAMMVEVKTVETYVTRILGKLGFDSRVQIATWRIEKGFQKKGSQ